MAEFLRALGSIACFVTAMLLFEAVRPFFSYRRWLQMLAAKRSI